GLLLAAALVHFTRPGERVWMIAGITAIAIPAMLGETLRTPVPPVAPSCLAISSSAQAELRAAARPRTHWWLQPWRFWRSPRRWRAAP
ncbi:MAG: hypothetical protein AAFP04_11835, partial [Myxococcota bacterium]